ncbi:MAG TPA: hypothetical protein VNW54_05550 [Granulicella sp.]|nr:hypothetical protein [Granulicella sp.]
MRVPFPVRIPLSYSVAYAVILCVVQLLEGTPLYFSLCTFGFIFMASVAFNLAGGFSRPSGGYVFFYAVVAVIFGLSYKAYLGEPGDSNLLNPKTTMLAYVASSFAMSCSAFFARQLAPRKSLLEGMGSKLDMGNAALGCIVLGFALDLWGYLDPTSAESSAGSFHSAIRQLNNFMLLGIILGVTNTIRQSGSRRFISLPVGLAITYMLVLHGILGFSKEGLFMPIMAVLVAAAALRFRFSLVQVCVFSIAMIFTVSYVVPRVQTGKGRLTTSLNDNLATAIDLVTSASQETAITGESYENEDSFVIHYYNQSHGLFDRLQMISMDDALIDTTEQGHVYGLYPVLFSFLNVVPHFIWKDKPTIPLGNIYSHEIGFAHSAKDDDDNSTGISFSPTGDAFHQARWIGVLVVAPAIWLMTFFGMDWLCGDTRKAPWGLMMTALASHGAPEGMLEGPIYMMTYGALSIWLAAVLATYVLPIVGTLITGPRKRDSTAEDLQPIL